MNLNRALLVAPLLLLTLTACSGSGSGSSADDAVDSGSGGSSSSVGVAEPAPDTGATQDGGDAAKASQGSNRAAVAPLTRSVVSTGQITLHGRDVAKSRSEILGLVAGWGGVVADEQTVSDDDGQISSSTLTLRVPSGRFDAAMDGLADVAEVEQQSRTSEDVSTQVIDNEARVRAAERSIQSIERLLSRATKLSDIITIESDLARRQADLDSLKQQQAYLADQTSLSTISVYLSRPSDQPKKDEDDQGFLVGLGHGWDGLRTATAVSLTVVGAVLPFGLVALLVGGPLWVVVRRRRAVPSVPTAEA